jgi:hypothetical protein
LGRSHPYHGLQHRGGATARRLGYSVGFFCGESVAGDGSASCYQAHVVGQCPGHEPGHAEFAALARSPAGTDVSEGNCIYRNTLESERSG